jgi:hypothetical protein
MGRRRFPLLAHRSRSGCREGKLLTAPRQTLARPYDDHSAAAAAPAKAKPSIGQGSPTAFGIVLRRNPLQPQPPRGGETTFCFLIRSHSCGLALRSRPPVDDMRDPGSRLRIEPNAIWNPAPLPERKRYFGCVGACWYLEIRWQRTTVGCFN